MFCYVDLRGIFLLANDFLNRYDVSTNTVNAAEAGKVSYSMLGKLG